jgi:hypothetical protein
LLALGKSKGPALRRALWQVSELLLIIQLAQPQPGGGDLRPLSEW